MDSTAGRPLNLTRALFADGNPSQGRLAVEDFFALRVLEKLRSRFGELAAECERAIAGDGGAATSS